MLSANNNNNNNKKHMLKGVCTAEIGAWDKAQIARKNIRPVFLCLFVCFVFVLNGLVVPVGHAPTATNKSNLNGSTMLKSNVNDR